MKPRAHPCVRAMRSLNLWQVYRNSIERLAMKVRKNHCAAQARQQRRHLER